MREIKFQVWDKRRKKMRDWEFVKITYMMLEIENSEYFIWMQYTGLKDKNGKEIYEGDIIEANIIKFKLKTLGQIVFDEYFLFYANKNDAGNTPLYNLDNIQKIGNIHENSELWEKIK